MAARIRKFVTFQLLLTYFVYPFGCKTLFATFDCIHVDDGRYLRSDLTINCDSSRHHTAEGFAWFMILAFPVGLPAMYFFMLWSNRSSLFDKEGSVSFLGFFFRDYSEQYYYWETVECVRKCFLMGFASFFQPGTLMQLIAVMLFTVVYCLVLTNCKPYGDPLDNTLAIMNQAMLFVTLLGALMLKFHQGFSSTGVTEEGYDMNVVNFLLLGSVAVVAVSAMIAVVYSVISLRKTLSEQQQSDGEEATKKGVEETISAKTTTKLVV
jgi:hypothetical protein